MDLAFILPSGTWDTLEELRNDAWNTYDTDSHDEGDPVLDDLAELRFDLTAGSPDYMSANNVRDDAEAYDDFEAAFPDFRRCAGTAGYPNLDGKANAGAAPSPGG